MSPRKEIEAPPLAPPISWEETEAVEGTLMASRPFSKEDTTLVHEFSEAPDGAGYGSEDGDFVVWGTLDLDRKLTQCEAGDRVFITYLGEERSKNNPKRKVKRFKVEVDG